MYTICAFHTNVLVHYTQFVTAATGAYGSMPLVQMLQDDRSACVLTWTFVEQNEGSPLGTYIVPKYGNKKGTPILFDGSRNIANAVSIIQCP